VRVCLVRRGRGSGKWLMAVWSERRLLWAENMPPSIEACERPQRLATC
jgi:hypothetical protein